MIRDAKTIAAEDALRAAADLKDLELIDLSRVSRDALIEKLTETLMTLEVLE